jgi:hypothetical protein
MSFVRKADLVRHVCFAIVNSRQKFTRIKENSLVLYVLKVGLVLMRCVAIEYLILRNRIRVLIYRIYLNKISKPGDLRALLILGRSTEILSFFNLLFCFNLFISIGQFIEAIQRSNQMRMEQQRILLQPQPPKNASSQQLRESVMAL